MGMFSEQLHPRGKGAVGGQFVAKGSSGSNDTVGYDAGRGTGAGYGSKGGDARVKMLQKTLNALGIVGPDGAPLAVDGKLGPKTTVAIKRLQRKLGLKADGLVTPALLKQIRGAAHKAHRAHSAHTKHVKHEHQQHNAHTAHVNHEKQVAAKKAVKAAPVRKAPR